MTNSRVTDDVIIVGAGFAGLYQLYSLRRMGFRARIVEAGSDIGGTWFWNRYPGARCDVESLDYSYSFDEQLQQDWEWSERYATQPEILSYINYVADRFDLRRHIVLNARVESAHFQDDDNTWQVTAEGNNRFICSYLIMATGCLSVPQTPHIEGLQNFEGSLYHSADWPQEEVSFSGKRVGLIGTGSSGVQMVPLVAAQARHLTVFQRTANYSVPSNNEDFSRAMIDQNKRDYPARRQITADTGSTLVTFDKSALDLTEEERNEVLESRWKGAGGGFRMMRAFNDLMTDRVSNSLVGEFVRNKIREVVKDKETAEALCPHPELPFATKRLCVDTDYYESFNRDNVTLIDLKRNPIVSVVKDGIQTASAKVELEIIVLATGFDAMTGALRAIDIKGQRGADLKTKWKDGPLTYLGLAVSGFPNMFILAGPGSPSVLSNMVHSIETHVEWVSTLLGKVRADEATSVEADLNAEKNWVAHVNEVANNTLYPIANSWYMGANIPGKPRIFMPYVGGTVAYKKIIGDVASSGYTGFVIQ